MTTSKLKYEDLENIKTDRVNIVVFNLCQVKRQVVFRDTWCIGTIFTWSACNKSYLIG